MQGCRKKPVGMLVKLYHKQKPKAIQLTQISVGRRASLKKEVEDVRFVERGYYELKIRVGKKCHRCKYFSQRTKTCDYCNIMRQSRLYTNGVRLDPRLCNKFVAGRRDYDPRLWNWGKDESND